MANSIAGTPVALNYGYNWIPGQKIQGATLQNTGNMYLDYNRIGFWLLGEGEMDGLVEMWDSGLGRLLYQSETDDPTAFHFHPGCDAIAGSGSYPSSTGGDQGVDSFWQYLPPGLQPLHYHRWAYYALKLKILIDNPSNDHQYDPSVWSDLNPIGLWRGIRCRIFEADGTMSGYGFTRNPAWHYVDLLCRRKLFREYSIDQYYGPDDLPAAVKARFDFAAIAESAAAYDAIGANGMASFTGDYSFSQRTTLQACVTQILTCSRSFERERAGRYSIVLDKPRTSVFTANRLNADSFSVSDSDVHSAASLYTGKFRDLLVPAAAQITGISCPDHQNPTWTTKNPHCFVANDYIVAGNTGTIYDTTWQVATVPDEYTFTTASRGSNYPAAVGSGGLVGLRYSRFKDRAPQFQHKALQLAFGAVGVGIKRQRNRRNKDTNFANCTWDQVARISKYQRAVELGDDILAYVTPPKATLRLPAFAPDAAGTGAIALQIEPGDVVTIDSTLSDAYAGTWDTTSEKTTLTSVSSSGQPTGGWIELTLRPYSDNNYPDDIQGNEPGWPDVPTLPGNPGTYTPIPLADGEAVFFTGSAANGDSFPMPDGFTPQNMLCWASPQGFVEGNAHLHYIQACDASANRKLTLIYNDSAGSTWGGDVNYCGIAWRTANSAKKLNLGACAYVELTLAGGEKLLFGKGTINSNDQVPVPDTYEINKVIPLAFPNSASDGGKPAHGFASFIDSNGAAHHFYMWATGETWQGSANTFICAMLNNNGTWRKDANGWFHCPLPDGRYLALGGQSIYTSMPTAFYAFSPPPGSPFPTGGPLPQIVGTAPGHVGGIVPPLAGMSSATIQCMPTPDGFSYNADHPAHGVKICTADRSTLDVTCLWEDGDGNQWGGSASVFSLLCDKPTGPMGGDPIPADPTRWGGTGSGSPTSSGGGGGSTGGGGGWPKAPTGCTVRGTLLTTPTGEVSNEEIKRRFDAGEKVFLVGRDGAERVTAATWLTGQKIFKISVSGCADFEASESHTLRPIVGQHTWCSQLRPGTLVDTIRGWAGATVTPVDSTADVLKIELAGPSHEYQVAGTWTHNVKPVSTL